MGYSCTFTLIPGPGPASSDENVELLEGALARSKDLVRQLQAQCEAMRAEAKEKEAKRKASARKHKMEIADLRAQLSALQVGTWGGKGVC